MDALTTPSNWQRVKVKDFGIIITGSTPLTQISEYWNGTISWITPTDINDNKDIFNSERKITQKGLDTIRMIPKNSVLVTCIASIGKNAILRVNGACNQQINAIIPNKDFNADFVYYLMENNKQYLLGKAGVTATYIISKQVFEEIDFFVPKDLNEQIAIANILSDVDRYLYSLDALILKKEGVKKALSFELLSQRKRLKGFNQNWQKVRLGDICEIGNGGAYETLIVENGDFKLISLNSIDIDGNLKNTMKRVNFYDNSLKQDDIVMVLSDVAHGDFLGLCAVIPNNDYVLNQRMGRLRKKNDCINILFLRLYINANQKYFKMQGQGSSQLNLSKKAIEDFEILLPPLNEQAAIANILSDVDHEIISLKNKKRQFENIKKALNHDLMSAKIRVLKK
ncbi:restriction endonuclease subunit S [Helicobacter pylori]|uniref:Restriction endonuclease subunit S n=1 Tax=Helicobacter pylori TaxID=210 RepID=A0A2T6STW3_HELPX|nr:restriction endonuclease subunit S [Helicobacter pylori]PUD40801.1 restriction endonuclease subunit S [Helicobacter pylori]